MWRDRIVFIYTYVYVFLTNDELDCAALSWIGVIETVHLPWKMIHVRKYQCTVTMRIKMKRVCFVCTVHVCRPFINPKYIWHVVLQRDTICTCQGYIISNQKYTTKYISANPSDVQNNDSRSRHFAHKHLMFETKWQNASALSSSEWMNTLVCAVSMWPPTKQHPSCSNGIGESIEMRLSKGGLLFFLCQHKKKSIILRIYLFPKKVFHVKIVHLALPINFTTDVLHYTCRCCHIFNSKSVPTCKNRSCFSRN